MGADWAKIKKEYLSGKTTYQKLAAKYHVSQSTLMKKAAADGWNAQRKKNGRKAEEKVNAAIVSKQADVGYTVYDAAMELLDAYRESVAAVRAGGRAVSSDMLQKYGQALKSIQSVIDGRKTELDIEEQKARIEKLRKECSMEASAAGSVTVVLEGCDEYAD